MRWRGQEARTQIKLKVDVITGQLHEVDCILFKNVHLPDFPETVRLQKTRGKTKSPPKKSLHVVNIDLPLSQLNNLSQVNPGKEPKTPVARARGGDRKKKTGGFDTAVGHNAAKSLLKLPPKTSGIFMPNDVKDEFLPEQKPRPAPLFRKKVVSKTPKKEHSNELQHVIGLLNPKVQAPPVKRKFSDVAYSFYVGEQAPRFSLMIGEEIIHRLILRASTVYHAALLQPSLSEINL